jgi:TetR/AcrR family transcriptional regulator, transcriptional repressor of aconitase
MTAREPTDGMHGLLSAGRASRPELKDRLNADTISMTALLASMSYVTVLDDRVALNACVWMGFGAVLASRGVGEDGGARRDRPRRGRLSADDGKGQQMGMAERRQQGRLTRARFLAAAAEEIAQRGYEGASLSDIAARVGEPKTALRYHYPTKADFARDILAYQSARWAQVRDAVLAQGYSGVRLLYTLVATATRQSAESAHARAAIMIELNSSALDFDLPPMRFDWYAYVEELIAEARQAGEIRESVDPRSGACALLDSAFAVYLLYPDLDEDEMIARLQPSWEASLWMMGVPDPPAYLETIEPTRIGPPPPLPERAPAPRRRGGASGE